MRKQVLSITCHVVIYHGPFLHRSSNWVSYCISIIVIIMGQTASKGLSKAAGNVAKKVTDFKPPLPARPPLPSSSTTAEAGGPPTPPGDGGSDADTTVTADAANPSNFLRGSGIATQDVRDVGQEMYLQHVQQRQQQQRGRAPPAPSGSTVAATPAGVPNQDMPPDLLKFIQDVGPAGQSVDTDLTAPRLLREENRAELAKVESVRKPARRRIRMPLMGDDDTFTTEKNTHFASSPLGPHQRRQADFGTTDLQLYRLLAAKKGDESVETNVVDAFHRTMATPDNGGAGAAWTDEETKKQREWLVQTLRVLDLPTLRMDSDNNILGFYPQDVPGPEVKSVRPIPETKVMLVLKDLVENAGEDGVAGGNSFDADMASKQLRDRRRDRIAKSGDIKQ